jgi:hypothetical protein
MEINLEMLKVVRFIKRQIKSMNSQILEITNNYGLASCLEVNDIVKDKGNGKLYILDHIHNGYPDNFCFIGNSDKIYITRSEIDYRFTKASQADLLEAIKYGVKPSVDIKHDTKHAGTKADFYMITVKGDAGSKVRHDNYKAAEKEAIRLAKSNNHRAHIMGVIAVVDPVVETKVTKSFDEEVW